MQDTRNVENTDGFSYTFEEDFEYSSDSDAESSDEGTVNVAKQHPGVWKKGTLWVHSLGVY